MTRFSTHLKTAWEAHGDRIILFSTLVCAVILAFEAGVMSNFSRASAPLSIEIPARSSQDSTVPQAAETKVVQSTSPVAAAPSQSVFPADCQYVGSKNSNLYHLPTCAAAKRIKPENRRCFASPQDAEKQGYKPGCLK